MSRAISRYSLREAAKTWLLASVVCVIVSAIHFLMGVPIFAVQNATLILNFFVTGLVFAFVIVYVMLRFRVTGLFKVSEVFGRYIYLGNGLLMLILATMSFFGDPMLRFLFWFFPGVIFATKVYQLELDENAE